MEDGIVRYENTEVAKVELYLLNDIVVNARSSNFIQNNKVVIERIPSIESQYCNYATGLVLAHDSNFALVKNSKNAIELDVETAIFLGGNGSWNYYHWMIEILPKIQFLKEANILSLTDNIIVSKSVETTDSFMKTLKQALQDVKINLIFLEPNEAYRVKNLYVVSAPNNILFNSKKIVTSPNYIFFRMESLEYVRNLVLSMMKDYNQDRLSNILAALKNKNSKLNIFLARKKGSARDYNQDEVWRLIEQECDIIQIYMEDYSIEEQAFIFSNADLIIGASGAAWTNLMFCKKDAVAISWVPKHLKDFSAYSTLAEYYGVKNYFIEVEPSNEKELHSSYKVPLDKLKIVINQRTKQ